MENKINILSTYPLDRELLEKIRKQRSVSPVWRGQSLDFTTIPFTEIVTRQDQTLLQRIQSLGTKPIVAIFTSANAVDMVFSILPQRPEWKIYCLSGKTKQAILKYLPSSAILDTAGDGKSLGEKIVSYPKNQEPLFFFCGNIRMPSLPDLLKAHNIYLSEIIVYHTRLTPVKTASDFDGILFFSPSAVNSFFSINKIADRTVCFSVGRTTSAALRKYTEHEIITSKMPGAQQVLTAVWDYFEHAST